MKNSAYIGLTAALGGGILNYFTRWNFPVELKLRSILKTFVLVTTAGTVVKLSVDEYNKERPKPS